MKKYFAITPSLTTPSASSNRAHALHGTPSARLIAGLASEVLKVERDRAAVAGFHEHFTIRLVHLDFAEWAGLDLAASGHLKSLK